MSGWVRWPTGQHWMKEEGFGVRRMLMWLVVICLVAYVAYKPDQAVGSATAVGGGIARIGTGAANLLGGIAARVGDAGPK